MLLSNLKLVEISSVAERVLIQFYQDDAAAQSKGYRAKRLTQDPQNELELLCLLALVERTEASTPLGQLCCYGITELGRSYAFSQLMIQSQ